MTGGGSKPSNVALALTSLPPFLFLIGMSGWLYLSAAVVLGTRFIVLAWHLRGDARLAMPTFSATRSSIWRRCSRSC